VFGRLINIEKLILSMVIILRRAFHHPPPKPGSAL